MIIDRILDRKNGDKYTPKSFYFDIMVYGEVGSNITRKMDYGTEEEVKQALSQYIDDQRYNPEIKTYINSVNWL